MSVDSFNPNDTAANWQGIKLTPAAAKQIHSLVKNNRELLGLRLAVKKSGCAGYAYDLSMANQDHQHELVYQFQGASIYIPLDAMPYLDGTEVDYVSEGINKVFKFNNPKAQNACGCGESFNADSDMGTL